MKTGSNKRMRVEIFIGNTKELPDFLGWDMLTDNAQAIEVMKDMSRTIKSYYYEGLNGNEIERLVEEDFTRVPLDILEKNGSTGATG